AARTAVPRARGGRVRPPAEPVPAALAGSPAADIFGRLVRMTDGPGQVAMKQAVSATLSSGLAARALEPAERWARRLAAEIDARSSLARLDEFTFALSAHVLGHLLGVPDEALPSTARWVAGYTAGVAPGADAARVAQAQAAAGRLIEMVGALSTDQGPQAPASLTVTLQREGSRAGCPDAAAVVANAIGFMTQAYEATAGLVGNTLLALAARPELRARVEVAPARLREGIREVLRPDAPGQNPARFLA